MFVDEIKIAKTSTLLYSTGLHKAYRNVLVQNFYANLKDNVIGVVDFQTVLEEEGVVAEDYMQFPLHHQDLQEFTTNWDVIVT